MNSPTPPPTGPVLERRLGLLPASALNMANMLGAGPFITISTLMSAMAGPQSMLGWIVALLIAIPDGMIWSELGASMPGSGGTYRYLREGFAKLGWGRLMGFVFLGYYDVCYLGDEVKDPGRTIPRSILISLACVAAIYIGINLSITGSVPWRTFVPEDKHPEAMYVVSAFMERIHGPGVARFFTIMVLWTCVGSCVALLLGYSRIPYAAARAGDFFAVFGKLHPTRAFPHVSLTVIGVLAIAGAFIRFGVVLDTLIATRILVQFAGQIAAVALLRRHQPNLPRPYRIWLYPAPLFLAGVGWTFVYCTLPLSVMLFSVTALIGAILLYIVWRKGTAEPGSPAAS